MWAGLPARAHDLRLIRAYGAWLHDRVRRHADREMYLGTFFLRNRPMLKVIRRLADKREHESTLRIAVLGCSIGAEVYSILWVLRRAHPDVEISLQAVDISREALVLAEAAEYGPETSDRVGSSIFARLTPAESQEMFDWEGDRGRVKPWLREGITWQLDDASDPELSSVLGPQDLVVANNFLCHMDAQAAERCLRTLVRLVAPGGHLVVSGIDLDVRTKVAIDLGWEPLPDLKQESHDGDPSVRADWPWHWWGLEPLDRSRSDWETRYASVFRIGGGSAREAQRRKARGLSRGKHQHPVDALRRHSLLAPSAGSPLDSEAKFASPECSVRRDQTNALERAARSAPCSP